MKEKVKVVYIYIVDEKKRWNEFVGIIFARAMEIESLNYV